MTLCTVISFPGVIIAAAAPRFVLSSPCAGRSSRCQWHELEPGAGGHLPRCPQDALAPGCAGWLLHTPEPMLTASALEPSPGADHLPTLQDQAAAVSGSNRLAGHSAVRTLQRFRPHRLPMVLKVGDGNLENYRRTNFHLGILAPIYRPTFLAAL